MSNVPIYKIKPKMSKVMFFYYFYMLVLALLLFGSITLLIYLLDRYLTSTYYIYITIFVFIIVNINLFLIYTKNKEKTYYFYTDHISISDQIVFLDKVSNVKVTRNFADKLFKTCSIHLDDQTMGAVYDNEKIIAFIQKLVSAAKQKNLSQQNA